MTSTKSTSTTPQATKAVEERKATRSRKAATPTGPAANVAGAKALENRKGRTTAKQAEVVKPDLVSDNHGGSVALPADAGTGTAAVAKAEVDRVERLRLAEAEQKALKVWQQEGEKGERPATPHLDAIKAGAAAPSSPRKAASTKGSSTRLSDEEVTKLIQACIKAGVTSFAAVLRNIRGDGHSVSQERCRTLYAALLPTGPTSTAKAAAPTAKATKAASTKATKTAASARKAS